MQQPRYIVRRVPYKWEVYDQKFAVVVYSVDKKKDALRLAADLNSGKIQYRSNHDDTC